MHERAAAASVRSRVRRGAKYARQAAREFAAVADGIDADLVAAVRVREPGDVDRVAELLRAELATGPVSVLITTNHTTTAPDGAQEDR